MAKSRQAKPLKDMLLDIIPENPLQEMVGALDGSSKGNGILAVMFFALVVGAAMACVGQRSAALGAVFEGVYAVCMQVIDWAMQLAPIGVACLIFAMTSRLGGGVFVTLIWFLATVMLATWYGGLGPGVLATVLTAVPVVMASTPTSATGPSISRET